ncbi:YihY family inner membrane protein [Marinomonas balearica]|uniref:tRNA-processing RNAse BN n=1 Tax=Marinomonas balearica TaxID=491947 RepID=A0A4R6MDY6_9GAMM|nr:YihY family inner membrane protein [Marinomonas balearica]TDO99626.1 tRNA-processing RNAse BN [Marinomonas balearica]
MHATQIRSNAFDILKKAVSRFNKSAVSQKASQLTLASLLAAVPIITIIFGILSLTPALSSLETTLISFIESNLAPGSSNEVISYLLSFSDQAKNLSLAGFVTLLVTALLLLNSFENSVQAIWDIHQKRSIKDKLLTYWAILTLGPILLAASLSLYGALISFQLAGIELSHFTDKLFDFGKFAIYTFMLLLLNYLAPNTNTSIKLSLICSAFGASLLILLNTIFANFAQFFANYQVIYGAFAALPIFLVWLQASWAIALATICLNATLHEWHESQ